MNFSQIWNNTIRDGRNKLTFQGEKFYETRHSPPCLATMVLELHMGFENEKSPTEGSYGCRCWL